ncbi:BamA/TamA family outer membrane protein [Ideonella dechloratans]|uniref:BamA/TamA family outer membrane protein n=2 Tax=Ideonella dechloratans TaxID=36863 RepID=A0A643FB30_IDEDE|nr:BamA/TamA family outer membrane protein [Ideonella dechloratans]
MGPLAAWAQAAEGVPAAPTASASAPAVVPDTAASAPSAPADAAAEPASAAASDAAPPPAAALPRLSVDAPGDLRALLENNLDLARALKLPEAGGLSDAEWSRLIAAAPAQAEDLARTAGYFNAQARITQLEGGGAQPLRVTLSLEPGPTVRIGRVTLQIQGELYDLAEEGQADAQALRQQLEQQWALPPGARFNEDAWGSAKTAVIAALRSAGYGAASWAGTAAEVDPQTNQVRIFAVADSGPLYRAGEVQISGLQRHDPERIRRLSGLAPGTPLTEARLQDYQERLRKTGLFDQVTVSMDPDPEQAGHATVLVQVRESQLQTATTALGISTSTGPRASLEHVHRQLFGYPLTATNKFVWGKSEQSWNGELSTYLNEHLQRDLVGGQVDRLFTDEDMVISQRLRVGRSTEHPVVERLDYLELDTSKECTRDGGQYINCDTLKAVSADTDRTWRKVDSVLLPTTGYTLSAQFGSGLADGSATRRGVFGRAYGRLTMYWPVGGWYTQGRLELGKVLTPAGVQVPDSLRFRAGGDNSVRGYAYRTLAPTTSDGGITGGRMLFTTSVEVAHPISDSLPSVWGALFVDAGRAADKISELKPALGYGLGVRWRSPVGPLAVDWAWGQEDHRGRIHLNVGIAF